MHTYARADSATWLTAAGGGGRRAGLIPNPANPTAPLIVGYTLRDLWICDVTQPPSDDVCVFDNYETVDDPIRLPVRKGTAAPCACCASARRRAAFDLEPAWRRRLGEATGAAGRAHRQFCQDRRDLGPVWADHDADAARRAGARGRLPARPSAATTLACQWAAATHPLTRGPGSDAGASGRARTGAAAR